MIALTYVRRMNPHSRTLRVICIVSCLIPLALQTRAGPCTTSWLTQANQTIKVRDGGKSQARRPFVTRLSSSTTNPRFPEGSLSSRTFLCKEAPNKNSFLGPSNSWMAAGHPLLLYLTTRPIPYVPLTREPRGRVRDPLVCKGPGLEVESMLKRFPKSATFTQFQSGSNFVLLFAPDYYDTNLGRFLSEDPLGEGIPDATN